MTRRIIYVSLACVALVTCASIIPKLTQQDVEKGKALYPDLTLEHLTNGRKVYIDHCGSCHQLYVPAKLPKEKWDKHLLPMAKQSKLDSASTEDMIRYIRVSRFTDTGQTQN